MGVPSQQAFANLLGLAIRTIAHYENDRPPQGEMLIRFHQLALAQGRPDLANTFWNAAAAELGQVGIQRIADIWSKAGAALNDLENGERVDFPAVLKDIKDICVEINPALQFIAGARPQEAAPKAKRK